MAAEVDGWALTLVTFLKTKFGRAAFDGLAEEDNSKGLPKEKEGRRMMGGKTSRTDENAAAGGSAEQKNTVIVFLVAMKEEAETVAKILDISTENRTRLSKALPCYYLTGKKGNLDIHICVNGADDIYGTEVNSVGTVNASLTTLLAVQALKPDFVISAGTCGGFRSQGCDIGTVVIGTEVINHDRRIPLPGYDVFGKGKIECWPFAGEFVDEKIGAKIVEKTNGIKGVVTSGNSLDAIPKDLEIMDAEKAAAKEMEAAAVGYVCKANKIPVAAIKCVTDIVDQLYVLEQNLDEKPTQEQFLENLNMACTNLAEAIKSTIEILAESC